jgi:MoCo/4Fe-4S cofactor protein with predicted Tat translocation signal
MKRVFHHPQRPKRPRIWRSLAELENSPGFETVLQREFPRGADVYEDSGLTKRDFMKLLGASMALAGIGVTGCRRPEAYLVPFNKGVEWTIPGKFLFYATAMPLRQGAMPLIVSTVDGRPTKIEGNPLHPFSNGGTDAFAQASILDLYDPNRSKAIKENGVEARSEAWDNLLKSLSTSAEGMAFLVERKNSPTRDRLRAELEGKFPGMIWCEYEPLGTSLAQEAISASFGQGVRLLPNFERADVILALDSEFLNQSDKGVGFAHGFFGRRGPDQRDAAMNRLYVVENHYTGTGGLADHRYRCKASLIGEFTRQLASHVSASGDDSALASILEACPKTAATFDEAWLSACADDLLANRGRSIVFVGEQQPVWVQILGHAINHALGNSGATIMGLAVDEKPSASLGDLAAAIEGGSVKTLFVLGGNPAYNAPSDLNFSDLIRKVSQSVRLGLFEDETSKLCRWHVPAAHYLEAWSDVRAYDGTYSVVQPMILPLWNGVSELEILAQLAGRPKPQGPALIQETFAQAFDTDPERWNAVLRVGFAPGSEWPAATLSFSGSPPGARDDVKPMAEGIELVFLQSTSVDDGRYANNSWLQETPDLESKVTWDNVALVSPATAEKLGIRALDDGSAGLFAVKNRGGIAIVQDPLDAVEAGMPRSALRSVEVDYCVPLAEIPPLLVRLSRSKVHLSHKGENEKRSKRNMSRSKKPGFRDDSVSFVCPECNGPLYETREGTLIKFNCQIGHSFSPESLTAAHTDTLERALWIAVRTLNERVAINEALAQKQLELKNTHLAERLAETAGSASHDVKLIREILDRL